ncbi:MAG: prolipoprotein diacylglyceryl transferase [Bacteroidales bacterium]|jgi:prolipoprotein diacylglyceryl transferase|nr:prolipoprotein diacylglyceryl transferase [Bacteroidales bacterium]
MNPLFITWNVSPVLFEIGSLSIRWYGILFAFAFVISYILLKKMFIKEKVSVYYLEKLTLYIFIGLIAGLRLGHCLFYEFDYYISHPIEMFLPIKETASGWKFIGYQGLASHGGAIGILIATFFYCRKTKIPYLWIIDRLVIAICFAGAAVRIGNLMNSEIYGVATTLPWGFIFVRDNQTIPCHPTQIYEALSYIILGIFLYSYIMKSKTAPKAGFIFGIFLIGLFTARFLIEFLKNNQEAWESTMPLNMGQLLSLPFIIAGIIILILSMKYQLGKNLNLSILNKNNTTKK